MSLQEQRKKAGFSQSKLSAVSGVNIRMIQQYESGERCINGAKLDTLCSLAIAMKCSICDILTDEQLKLKFKKAK